MRKKIEKILFESHPFLAPLAILFLFGLPWWIAYWPGTLQYDSCGQLLQYIGLGKMTAHHPLPVTMLMGSLLDVGRVLFDSDNVGIFLYTAIQFLAQCLVLAYGFCVMKRIRVPMGMRWMSLVYYALFPLLSNWGISYGKDTGYYISFLLFVLVIIDVFLKRNGKVVGWQLTLWILSLMGLVVFRNDGRYVVVLTIIALFISVRRYWKTYLIGVCVIFGFLMLVEHVYMPLRNIPSGSVREALSVPLMQTSNYLGQHMDEVTEEEREVLSSLFMVTDFREVAEAYDTEISDDVKGKFKEYPEKQELLSYLKVWLAQFTRHPETYIETFWNHCDGYFNPAKKCYEDIIGWFKILDGQSRSDEYLDISFGMKSTYIRDKLESWSYLLYELPVIGLLYRTAIHTWFMFGSMLVLLWKKRGKDIIPILPGIVVLLICMVSPLNASVRYFLPVMATTPVYLALCAAKNKKEKEMYEESTE